jgi:hypothetical protein
MRAVMVRYQVMPEYVEKNEHLVRSVYTELEGAAPAGIRYQTFRLEDGVSFVHLYCNERVDGTNPLRELLAFQAFQRDISDRCDDPPTPTELHKIGSYFGSGPDAEPASRI